MADDTDEAPETTDADPSGDDAQDAVADEPAAKGSTSKGKGKGDAAAKDADEGPKRTVTRRQVTSKRVTPKGGGAATPTGPKKAAGKGTPVPSTRYTPPSHGAYAKGPSPIWVPILLFSLLILGALIIMTNYMGVFGDPANLRLVIGLLFILAGIIVATQYR